MKRYLVHDGRVRSRHDGEWHVVSAREVSRLYRVDPHECVFRDLDARDGRLFGVDTSGLIPLYPDPSGRYELPVVAQSEAA
jgi:hypothetical protein